MPVSKLYNLLPAYRWRRFATRKVTVGLASHQLCITDFVICPPMGSVTLTRK